MMTTNNKTDLVQDAATPDQVISILLRAAEAYYESSSELASAWQDDKAGRVWREFAKIMERAARSCEQAIAKYV